MFGWLRRIESGTTTYRDAQAAVVTVAGAFAIGAIFGAVFTLLMR